MSFKTVLSVILIVALTNSVLCDKNEKHDMWLKHRERVSRFTCKKPQPRAIEIQNLMDPEKFSTYKSIDPSFTVLYRCDAAGCCGKNKQCTPQKYEEISLIARARHLTTAKSFEFITIIARNHTECSCQFKTDKPK